MIRILIVIFLMVSICPPELRAGEVVVPLMPAPGAMVSLSNAFMPAHLMGITIHPDNALQFDFLIHKGDGQLDGLHKRQEYQKLVKYFLASLAIPDHDQWVNLSPYEHNRIIKDNFGKTEMGRDLLAQDYLLKQITSSLMYPESGLGKAFWDMVYARAWKEYGTTNIPVSTFNKVWIVPDQAAIYENGNTAYILKSHLKVMLEEDYLASSKNTVIPADAGVHSVASQVIREVILPELEKEVNEGKNFAMLRQVLSGMILATWYKKALRQSLLGKVYADQGKVKGVDQNPRNNEAIYQAYLAAFKKGVYNYIKDTDTPDGVVPRKYFAGGISNQVDLTEYGRDHLPSMAMIGLIQRDFAQASIDQAMVDLKEQRQDAAMTRRVFLGGAGTGLATVAFSGLLSAQDSPNALVDDKIRYANKITNPDVYKDGSKHPARKIMEILQEYQAGLFKSIFGSNNMENMYQSKATPIRTPITIGEIEEYQESIKKRLVEIMGNDWKPKSNTNFNDFIINDVKRYLAQNEINISLNAEYRYLFVFRKDDREVQIIPFDCFIVHGVNEFARQLESFMGQEIIRTNEVIIGDEIKINNQSILPSSAIVPVSMNAIMSANADRIEAYPAGLTVTVDRLRSVTNVEVAISNSGDQRSIINYRLAQGKHLNISSLKAKVFMSRIDANVLSGYIKHAANGHEGRHFSDRQKFKSFTTSDLEIRGYLEQIYSNYFGWLFFLANAPNYLYQDDLVFLAEKEAFVFILDNFVLYIQSHRREFPMIVSVGGDERLKRDEIEAQLYKLGAPGKTVAESTASAQLLYKVVEFTANQHKLKMEKDRLSKAQVAKIGDGSDVGGIDMNSANLAMTIKRNGKGVPLPIDQQDLAQLNSLQGFDPEIVSIKTAAPLPFLAELKPNLI